MSFWNHHTSKIMFLEVHDGQRMSPWTSTPCCCVIFLCITWHCVTLRCVMSTAGHLSHHRLMSFWKHHTSKITNVPRGARWAKNAALDFVTVTLKCKKRQTSISLTIRNIKHHVHVIRQTAGTEMGHRMSHM